MERANRFIQQWTGREGYSAIPQVDSENPGIQLEEFSLPSERNSELVLKQKAVLKYATIGAILLFGMLGFTALVRIHSRQEMERESLSLYAPCHTECSDPCTSWENKNGQRLCCNWTYGPLNSTMCSLTVAPGGDDCYCVGEPLSMQATEPTSDSPTAAPTAQPPWAQYLPDAYNPFKPHTQAPVAPLPAGSPTLAPWRQYVPDAYQSYVTPSEQPSSAPAASDPSAVVAAPEEAGQASAEKADPTSGGGAQ